MKKFITAVLKKQDDKITFIASDETLDRAGEVIPIESWDLKNFKKNPVLLVNHDYKVQNIVGLATHIRIEDKALLFEPDFHEITQLSKEVKQMVEAEVLNTVSVGFRPLGPKKDGDLGTNELYEISFVPVPANPSASRLEAVMAKSVEATELKSIEAWIKKCYSCDLEGEEVNLKPYPNEHSCRLNSPDKYDKFARKNCYAKKDDKCIDFIFGIKDNKSELQAMRFNKDVWDEGDARAYCKEKDGSFEAAKSINIAEIEKDFYIVLEELRIIKEGRVLSGKNRKLISDAVSILKSAATALDELLSATDANGGKDSGDKGREPKVVKVQSETDIKEIPVSSAVLRALQGINRETNDLLNKLKKAS